MAYTQLSAKDGGGTLRQFLADVVSGNYFARIKMLWGAEGAVNEVANASPMPVTPRDSTGLEYTAPEMNPENAVYFIPAVSIVSGGQAVAFTDTSASSSAITGTNVVLTATQPCFVRQGATAVVDTDTYIPANVSRPMRITSGVVISVIKPTGGTDGTLYISVIG